MESITIKVHKDMARKIDKAVKKDYSTKTEFIRAAIREKIKQIENDKVLKALKEFQGSAKKHISNAEFEKNRELAYTRLAKKRGWKLD